MITCQMLNDLISIFFLFLYIFSQLYLCSFEICVVRKLMPFLTNFIKGFNCCKRDLEVIMIWNHTKVFKVFQIVYIFNGINLTKAMVIMRMQKKMCCPICYENKFRNFRMRFLLFMPDSIVTCGPKRRTAACRRVKRCWEGNCGRKPR